MSSDSASKIAYMEGLRGFAALQVLLLHYLTFFLPSQPCSLFLYCWQEALRQHHLGFVFDGVAAVGLFFGLSGYVLSRAYLHKGRTPFKNLALRWFRLQIPIAAALLFSAAVLTFSQTSYLDAAQLNGSFGWVKTFFIPPVTGVFTAYEILVKSLVVGYRATSVFSGMLPGLTTGYTLNPPLWSLHTEFWGSLMIILLAYVRARDALLHRVVLIGLFIVFAFHPLVLFLLGHALFQMERTREDKGRQSWKGRIVIWVVGGCALLAGLWLYDARVETLNHKQLSGLLASLWFKPQTTFHYTGYIGAALVFVGVTCLPALQWVLRWRPLVYAGRLSFGMYLLHMPILMGVVAPLQLYLDARVTREMAAGLALVAGVGITFLMAHAFTLFVDGPVLDICRHWRRGHLVKAQETAVPVSLS